MSQNLRKRSARPVHETLSDELPEKSHALLLMMLGLFLCTLTSLVMATIGLAIAERVDEGYVIAGVLLGAATLNGFLQGGRWAVDSLFAPWLGALADHLGFKLTAFIGFAGMTILLYAMPFAPMGILALLLLAFSVLGCILGLGLLAEAGRGGSVMIARFATAADLGSTLGPLLGWWILNHVMISKITFHVAAAIGVIAMASVLIIERKNWQLKTPVLLPTKEPHCLNEPRV